jgi:hypothetical protein
MLGHNTSHMTRRSTFLLGWGYGYLGVVDTTGTISRFELQYYGLVSRWNTVE